MKTRSQIGCLLDCLIGFFDGLGSGIRAGCVALAAISASGRRHGIAGLAAIAPTAGAGEIGEGEARDSDSDGDDGHTILRHGTHSQPGDGRCRAP